MRDDDPMASCGWYSMIALVYMAFPPREFNYAVVVAIFDGKGKPRQLISTILIVLLQARVELHITRRC
jgi:hypothetical protein